MAVQFQIKRGKKANISSAEKIVGCWYITTDTCELFVCNDDEKLDPVISGGVYAYSDISELPSVGNSTIVYFIVSDSVASMYKWSDDTSQYRKIFDYVEIDNLRQRIDDVQQIANSNNLLIVSLQTSNAELADRIKDIENFTSQDSFITNVSSEFVVDETSHQLSLNMISRSKVEGLESILSALSEGKVDIVTSNYKGEDVAWTLLSPENQEKLELLDINGGNIEISGKVNAANVEGLSTYIILNRDSIDGLLSVEDKRRIDSSIEGLCINGNKISPSEDNTVSIPFATNSSYGVVIGDFSENRVSVNDDGTMEVNSLNVNKLVQTDGDTLILNSGTSAV